MRLKERIELARRLGVVLDVAEPELEHAWIEFHKRKKDGVTILDNAKRPIRLSQRYLDGLCETSREDAIRLFVTREVIPLGYRSDIRSRVLDGRRIAQLLDDLRIGRGLTTEELLYRIETDRDAVIRPAIAGHAASRVIGDDEAR